MTLTDSLQEIAVSLPEIKLSTENKIYNSVDRLREEVDQLKMDGKKIGYVTGTFDIEHLGHAAFLNFAKEHCDVLIAGVGNDAITIATKGQQFFNQDERCQMLSSSTFVDLIFKMDNPNSEETAPKAKTYLDEIVVKINPDIIIASSKTDANFETKKKVSAQMGIQFVEYSAPPFSSSTKIREWIDKSF